MGNELIAWAADSLMGIIERDPVKDKLQFTYDAGWMRSPQGFPLSLSMPLAVADHGHAAVLPFIDGLISDNTAYRANLGKKFGVSPRNPFALLTHIGEECAGAVQFIRRSEFQQWLDTRHTKNALQWVTEDDLAVDMVQSLANLGVPNRQLVGGRFSLAGAQAKSAYFYDEKTARWAIPSGSYPTTHILKPTPAEMAGHALNEHFCLRLAKALDMTTASSEIKEFGGITVFVTKRYDRQGAGHKVSRIHQEDMCQTLGIPTRSKYQNEGGPSADNIVKVIKERASEPDYDVAAFVRALIFNWIVAGTDAHAKNYSFLIGPREVVFAPLYDLGSYLPTERRVADKRIRLAMKIHNTYELMRIGRPEWAKAAKKWGVEPDWVMVEIDSFLQQIPELTKQIRRELKEYLKPVEHKNMMDRLQTELECRCGSLLALRS